MIVQEFLNKSPIAVVMLVLPCRIGFIMLDTLIIHIPMRSEFVRQNGNLFSVVGDVADYQIRAVPSYLKRDLLTGAISYGDLRHPYESLPSSYSGMAIKFNAVNVANTPPYISLNASCKILQGHNIYGGSSVRNLASEMLHLLKSNYPEFFACLDLRQATISRIDATFSVRLEHERLVQPCLRFLSNISKGQRKTDKDRRDFYNTVYWGGKTSREGGAKAYGKHTEVMNEVAQLKAAAKKGCSQSAHKLTVFTDELLSWSANLLRFESSTKKRKLEKLGLPTNLWHFIEYQQQNKDVLIMLWRMWFDPILQAISGDVQMENVDDAEIYELCRKNLVTVTAKGRLSYTKANNAFNFYQLLKNNGWEDIKKRYQPRTFQINVKSLCDLGIPRALLQNLYEQQAKSVPMVDLVKFDFSNQYPADYQPVISEHITDFDYIIKKKPNLRLVA